MSLFKRVSDNIRANINALLDKVEDPGKLLDQYVYDMSIEVNQAKAALLNQATTMIRIEKQAEMARQKSEERRKWAEVALTKGEEQKARIALTEKGSYDRAFSQFSTQLVNAQIVHEDMLVRVREMDLALSEMQVKRDTLKSRLAIAKSYESVVGATSGLGKNGAQAGFARMEDKVLTLESRSEALTQLDRALNIGKTLNPYEYDVDLELEALKAEMGLENKTEAVS